MKTIVAVLFVTMSATVGAANWGGAMQGLGEAMQDSGRAMMDSALMEERQRRQFEHEQRMLRLQQQQHELQMRQQLEMQMVQRARQLSSEDQWVCIGSHVQVGTAIRHDDGRVGMVAALIGPWHGCANKNSARPVWAVISWTPARE